MSCELPSARKYVSIFLDSKTESKAFVLSSPGEDKNTIFIGRLNLQRLGFFNQMSRLYGNLGTLYIAKNTSGDITDTDNGENGNNDD
jgi:hypothetical protein